MPTHPEFVLSQIEGDYLVDYALFTGALREYLTRTIEERFKADPNDVHRRFFTLAVFHQEYSAYEDLGAMLDAIMTHQVNSNVPILSRIAAYKVGEVQLSAVMNRFSVSSADDLYDRLGLADLIPLVWAEILPNIQLVKVLKTCASFFFVDCQKSQRREGLQAFNKLKHGLLAVPEASIYAPGISVDAPATIFRTSNSKADSLEKPITIYAIRMGAEEIEDRLRAIHFVQSNLRLLAALLAIRYQPNRVVKRLGSASNLLTHPNMKAVVDFARQVSDSAT